MAENTRPARGPHGGPHGGPRVAEKPENFGRAVKRLLRFLKPFYPAIIAALVFAALATVCSVAGPTLVQELTNTIQASFSLIPEQVFELDMEKVLFYCFLLVGIYAASLVCSFIQSWLMAGVTQKNSRNMRRAVSEKINDMPLKYFDSHTVGDTLSLVTNDVDTIGQTLNQSVSTLVTATVMLVGCVIMMFVTNWVLAFTAIGASLIGFVFMFLIMGKSQKYFARQQAFLGEINGHIEESYAGHNVVKAYNAERKVKNTFNEINYRLYTSAWKSQFFSGIMMPLMTFIGNLGYVAVCVVGAVLFADGTIQSGEIVAFMIYVRLFTSPLSQLAQAFTSIQSAAAAGERVFRFLDETSLADESGKTAYLPADKVRGDVAFEHVRFGYDPDKIIIHDFSAEAKAGQKIAIVGPTGAGKTTMVNLLMRFYEINGGTLKVDGHPIDTVTRDSLRGNLGMVLQETWLKAGTVADNIAYGKPDATREEIIDAARRARAHSFICRLPQGYDTVIAEDGGNISQGQKQLLCIARVMLRKPPILILDEATSSIDTRTEVLVQDAFEELMKGRTSFIVAHRLSTIKNADQILVMKAGNIIERGTHEELLARGGFYANLYASQFAKA